MHIVEGSSSGGLEGGFGEGVGGLMLLCQVCEVPLTSALKQHHQC